MSLLKWARREIEIAKNSYKDDDKAWNEYSDACYDSAFKAYESLVNDNHSGMSIGVTRNILIRLIDGMPLTPIEDTDNIWGRMMREKNNSARQYSCIRMSGLYKYISFDGKVTYSDVNRITCIDVENPNCTYYSGLVCRIIDELYPITFPYSGEKISVYCHDILTDPDNGDFDTMAIFYAKKKGDDKCLNIQRYYKEGNDGWVEISIDEYNQRKERAELRKKKLEENNEH